MPIQTINPATGDHLQSYALLTDKGPNEISKAIGKTHQAWLIWRDTPLNERLQKLQSLAQCLQKNKKQYAQLVTQEMGKPISEAIGEIEKCAWVCDYYAENAANFLADRPIMTGERKNLIVHQPIGIVLAVMPWNFPFWQVFRFAIPALTAGNAGLLKHASNVTGCAYAIEKLFRDAGFPNHLLKALVLDSKDVESVIHHPKVRAVTVTGSENAGRSIAASAGHAIKKSVLELGGSDAYIVLEDADIKLAAKSCITSRLTNSGQSCIGAKRFIVVDAVRAPFEAACQTYMHEATVGDPTRDDTDVGPIARDDLRSTLHHQVMDSIDRGAYCLLGGEMPTGKGFYYPPTLLTDVTPDSPAYQEELFGPVATIITVQDESEAIHIANDSLFGLGTAVFTKNNDRGMAVARQLEAGCCAINDFVRSDPRLPFGGIKNSGYGRELSDVGIREFVNVKTITGV